MTRKHQEDDDYKTFTMDGTLEQRVKAWVKFAEFRHIGIVCTKCGKSTYAFTPEDAGFCVACYKSSNPEAKHKRGWSGIGANAHKKQKGKNVIEGNKEEDKK